MKGFIPRTLTLWCVTVIYSLGVSVAVPVFISDPVANLGVYLSAMLCFIALQLYEKASYRRKWGPR